jgi:hypothetical protein
MEIKYNNLKTARHLQHVDFANTLNNELNDKEAIISVDEAIILLRIVKTHISLADVLKQEVMSEK